MAIICLVIGALLALVSGWQPGQGHAAREGHGEVAARERTAAGPVARSDDGSPEAQGMSRGQLESEVERLTTIVHEKDAKIADLEIRLKLATAGSRTN